MVETDFNSPFRRSSTGVLLSPEVDVITSTSKIATGEISESDGIWILKKDSQRRQTLFKVLSEDEKKICETWMEKIENDRNEKNFLQMVRMEFIECILSLKFSYIISLFTYAVASRSSNSCYS